MIAGSETGNGRASSLTDKSRVGFEPRQQRAARGVGERGKGAVEFGVLKLNH